jgi:hypothetical protein
MENHEQEIPSHPDSYMNDEIGREPQVHYWETLQYLKYHFLLLIRFR